MDQQRAQWGSRLGFILAAAGSAVGLGRLGAIAFPDFLSCDLTPGGT
jgi:SNF family Na+-dependent transporter